MTARYDAADPETAKLLEAERKAAQRADADVLRKLMMSRNGRAWLRRKLEGCFIFDEPFRAGQPDATAHNLGRQSAGKQLMAEAMAASLDLYLTMMREGEAEAKRREALLQERGAATSGPPRPPTADDQFPYLTPPEAPPAEGERK